MIKTDFMSLYEELNTLNEGYCLELAGYKVGDIVEFKHTNAEYKHGVVIDVWPKEENPRYIFGIFNLDSWGMIDTPFRDIAKKITINELTPKEKENYNRIKTTIDKRIKEVSNNLNEEVLEEKLANFSEIPVEDLLTKCIIDGKPWPYNPDAPEKSGVVPFHTALNHIVNVVKNMSDENKADFTLDWIAVGSVKDLTDEKTRRPGRDLEYRVAVSLADKELNQVISQVGSDETEFSSLKKLPILLKSNIIMCCRPSAALEEANKTDDDMGNIIVYLGGVGKLSSYYYDIQAAFKQIKKAYEGGFFSKVAKKLFK